MVLILAFWISQQLSDFHRRAGYVFDTVKRAARQSIWIYGARIMLLLAYRPDTVAGFMVVMLLPGLPINVAGLLDSLRDRPAPAAPETRSILMRLHFRLAKWNMGSAPLRWIGLHFPIMLVGALHSLESAAILGSIRAVTTFANIFFELLETIVPAWLSSKLKSGPAALKSGSTALFWAGALLWLLGALLIWIGGEWLIRQILGPAYAGETLILDILWLGNGLYFAGRVVTLHHRMNKNTRLEFLSLTAGVAGFLLSVPLIGTHGALGGACCLMITQAATLLGLYLANRHTGKA